MRDCLRILHLVDDLDDPHRETIAHIGRLIGHLDRQHFQPTVAVMCRSAHAAAESVHASGSVEKPPIVIPANAGIHLLFRPLQWAPAFAGGTSRGMDRSSGSSTNPSAGIDSTFDGNGLPCPVTTIGFPGAVLEKLPQALGRDFLSRARLARAIRAGHYDVVCAYDLTARIAGLPAARDAGVGVRIACVRDLGHTLRPQQLEALKKANAAATWFVATSAAGSMRLVRQEKAQRDLVEVIPGGVELPSWPERSAATIAEAKHAFGLSVHQPVIFMDAPIVPIKDHATFLAAAAYLAPLHPHARFVCLGHGTPDALAHLRRDAAQARIADHLIVTDELSSRAQWLRAADVAVLTSLSESCSETLLSYMAAGLPIVATSVGGNPELIRHGECGYLFDPKEADALAMRINIFLLVDDLATRLGAASRERVRTEFTVANEVRRWTDTWRALVYLSADAHSQM